jgi:hypothetical protein
MNPSSISTVQGNRGGPSMSGLPSVTWVRPGGQTFAPPPMQRSQARERAERANAYIVIALTFACTALAIFDLFLLAAGS